MKFPSFRWFSCSLCALAAVWVGVPATAQTPGYPARMVKIIDNFPAGGPSDILARTVAEALQGTLKQTFIVERKPGAGGNVSVDMVAKSTTKGHTSLQ